MTKSVDEILNKLQNYTECECCGVNFEMDQTDAKSALLALILEEINTSETIYQVRDNLRRVFE